MLYVCTDTCNFQPQTTLFVFHMGLYMFTTRRNYNSFGSKDCCIKYLAHLYELLGPNGNISSQRYYCTLQPFPSFPSYTPITRIHFFLIDSLQMCRPLPDGNCTIDIYVHTYVRIYISQYIHVYVYIFPTTCICTIYNIPHAKYKKHNAN